MNEKKQQKFECKFCRHQTFQWSGVCPNCKLYNTMRAAAENFLISSMDESEEVAKVIWPTGDPIFDGVSGTDGVVRGGQYLIAGIAGAGKSTVVMQAAGGLAKRGQRVLYVAGEEELSGIIDRAKRVGARHPNLMLLDGKPGKVEWEQIQKIATKFDVAIYDSIQRLQVKASHCTQPITRILVSQLNGKDEIAQGRDNEHDPDVLIFCDLVASGDDPRREIRSTKNRFGEPKKVPYLLTHHAVINLNPNEPEGEDDE